ncbi:MAG TPA: nucleotidyltransferase family protein [Candidatus Limnocylindria bacterium]|jgi:nicotine blue oxidoreductase
MTDPAPVAAVILAAGLGRRFGRPKATASLAGASFLDRVSARAADAGLDPVIAVVPPRTATPTEVTAVVNPAPERGLSSSLQLGIGAVPAGHAALILLVDQPTLERTALEAILGARGHRPVVAASADARLGPPVLLEPDAFPLATALSGDIGLREVLAANPELVQAVPVPAHAPDVDTPADLERLEARLGP